MAIPCGAANPIFSSVKEPHHRCSIDYLVGRAAAVMNIGLEAQEDGLTRSLNLRWRWEKVPVGLLMDIHPCMMMLG